MDGDLGRPTRTLEQQRSIIGVTRTQLPSPRFQAWADASGAAAEVPYTVYVHTADVAGAGTDANVYLELNGDFGSSGPRRLHASWKNCFERGHVDEFALGSVELGDLRSVRVGHDGAAELTEWVRKSIRTHIGPLARVSDLPICADA